jgi:DNA repair ATPase RecN
MQVALVLMQMQQPVETARALGLLQRLQALATSEAEALRPLARLLAGMLSSQRRLEEQLERHAAQLRDAQRRIDRLDERLEAMRAIERSLGPRGTGAPAARPVAP